MIKPEFFRERGEKLIPYVAALYYIEVIYLMFMVNFLFGKIFAVVSGLILALLLSFQVVALFNRRNLSRKIQLFLMDIHFAYAAAFVFNRLMSDITLSGGDITMTVVRVITASLELPMIIILTDEFIIKRYE